MPDLRLPSQPQGITALLPVPNYTAWWQGHMHVNNLPKVVTWKRTAETRTRDLFSRKSNALTITPPGHWCWIQTETVFTARDHSKGVRRILVRGSMPPCRLRRRKFWKFDYEMVHAGVYLNKCGQHSAVLYNIAFTSTPHPPFRKLLFCMFPLFNFSCIFPGGQLTPFAPMYILYAHGSRAYKMILMNMGRTQVCCVNTDTSVYGPSTRVVCTNPDTRRLRREYQRILSVCLSHARIATFLAMTMHTLQFINLPLSKCYSLGRPM